MNGPYQIDNWYKTEGRPHRQQMDSRKKAYGNENSFNVRDRVL